MAKLETYCDLRDAALNAAQARKERELEIFAALEAIDPELVKDELDLMNSPVPVRFWRTI